MVYFEVRDATSWILTRSVGSGKVTTVVFIAGVTAVATERISGACSAASAHASVGPTGG